MVASIVERNGYPAHDLLIYILLKLGSREAIRQPPVKMIVESRAMEGGFHAGTIASAGIGHHAPIAEARCHNGNLLVAHLHIESG